MGCTEPSGVYRPRRPRESPLWRLTEEHLETLSKRRKHWARLIAKVFEVDPLRCPCGATMRIVAVILEPPVIRKILDHLARPEALAHAQDYAITSVMTASLTSAFDRGLDATIAFTRDAC